MRVEWTLSFLREAFDVLYANHDYRIPESKFLDFASAELNGMGIYIYINRSFISFNFNGWIYNFIKIRIRT